MTDAKAEDQQPNNITLAKREDMLRNLIASPDGNQALLLHCADDLIRAYCRNGLHFLNKQQLQHAFLMFQKAEGLTAEGGPMFHDETKRLQRRAVVINNLGLFYHHQGDFVASLSHFRTAIELEEQLGSDCAEQPATTYFNLGQLLSQMRNPREAKLAFRKALDIAQKRLEKVQLNFEREPTLQLLLHAMEHLAATHEALGEYHFAARRYVEVIKFARLHSIDRNLEELDDRRRRCQERESQRVPPLDSAITRFDSVYRTTPRNSARTGSERRQSLPPKFQEGGVTADQASVDFKNLALRRTHASSEHYKTLPPVVTQFDEKVVPTIVTLKKALPIPPPPVRDEAKETLRGRGRGTGKRSLTASTAQTPLNSTATSRRTSTAINDVCMPSSVGEDLRPSLRDALARLNQRCAAAEGPSREALATYGRHSHQSTGSPLPWATAAPAAIHASSPSVSPPRMASPNKTATASNRAEGGLPQGPRAPTRPTTAPHKRGVMRPHTTAAADDEYYIHPPFRAPMPNTIPGASGRPTSARRSPSKLVARPQTARTARSPETKNQSRQTNKVDPDKAHEARQEVVVKEVESVEGSETENDSPLLHPSAARVDAATPRMSKEVAGRILTRVGRGFILRKRLGRQRQQRERQRHEDRVRAELRQEERALIRHEFRIKEEALIAEREDLAEQKKQYEMKERRKSDRKRTVLAKIVQLGSQLDALQAAVVQQSSATIDYLRVDRERRRQQRIEASRTLQAILRQRKSCQRVNAQASLVQSNMLRCFAQQQLRHRSAQKIQRFFRTQMREINRMRIEESRQRHLLLRQTHGATLLQALLRHRASCCRAQCRFSDRVHRNLSTLQARVRGLAARRVFDRMLQDYKHRSERKRWSSAMIIQWAWCAYRIKRDEERRWDNLLSEQLQGRTEYAVTKIQSTWRMFRDGYRHRREWQCRRKAKLEALRLEKEAEIRHGRRCGATTVLQRAWRCWKARRALNFRRNMHNDAKSAYFLGESRKAATVTLQRFARCCIREIRWWHKTEVERRVKKYNDELEDQTKREVRRLRVMDALLVRGLAVNRVKHAIWRWNDFRMRRVMNHESMVIQLFAQSWLSMRITQQYREERLRRFEKATQVDSNHQQVQSTASSSRLTQDEAALRITNFFRYRPRFRKLRHSRRENCEDVRRVESARMIQRMYRERSPVRQRRPQEDETQLK